MPQLELGKLNFDKIHTIINALPGITEDVRKTLKEEVRCSSPGWAELYCGRGSFGPPPVC